MSIELCWCYGGKLCLGNCPDTDPQRTGIPPQEAKAESEEAKKTAQLVQSFLRQVAEILVDEDPANMVLLERI